MAQTYNQTATVAPAGSIVACSGATLIGSGQEQDCLCTVGGTGAGSAVTVGGSQLDAETSAGVMYELSPVNTIWSSGNWTVRLNVTTANANVTWVSTYICRLNSSNVSQATIGSLTGQTTSLGTTGVKSHTVSGSSQSPAAGDKVYIVLIFTSTAANQSFGVQFNSSIDSPFTDLTPLTFAPSADAWQNLSDGSLQGLKGNYRYSAPDDFNDLADAVAYDQGAPGTTPKTFTGSDDLNFWSDGTLNLKGVYQLQAPDTWQNLADAVAVSTLAQKQFTGSDNLNNWADAAPALKSDYRIDGSDPWGNLADQIGVTLTGLQPLTFSGTDSLNNWADTPAALRMGALVVSPAADSLNNWLDSVALTRVGLLTFAGTDSLNNWVDAPAVFEALNVQSTDTWANLADQFNIGGQAALTFTATDNLNNWADQPATRLAYLVAQTDPWANLADSLAVFRATPNITLSLSDTWQTLSDGTLAVTGRYQLQATETWQNLADQLAAVRGVGLKTFTGADDLNNWAEVTSRFIADYLLAGDDAWGNLADSINVNLTSLIQPKTFTGTDSLNNWADAPQVRLVLNVPALSDSWLQLNDLLQVTSGGLIGISFIDGLGVLADQIAVSQTGAYRLQLADDWATLADSPTVNREVQVTFTDSWANLADTYDRSRGYPVTFTDPWANLADQAPVRSVGIVPSLTDPWANLNDSAGGFFTYAYRPADTWQTLADQLITGAQGTLVFTATDNLNNWLDQPAVVRALLVAVSDQAANLADSIAGARAIVWTAVDDAANLADQLKVIEARLVAFADDAANFADQFFVSTIGGQFQQLTDVWNTLADQIALVTSHAPQFVETWQTLADEIALRLSIIQILISQVSEQTESTSEVSAGADLTSALRPTVELTSEVST